MASDRAPRVVVIGLDSGDRDLIAQWCDRGALPVLRALRERGVTGMLTSAPGLGDDATWNTFRTSLGAGRHGRYHYRPLLPGSYTIGYEREGPAESFWEALSRAGRRVAVLDVPKCGSARPVNGLHVTNWVVHGRDNDTASSPPELADELVRRCGADRTDGAADYMCLTERLSETLHVEFVERLITMIRAKAGALCDLLRREPWDLFLTVFKEPHCAGHQLWDSPHDGRLLQVYQALDAAIGEVLVAAGPESDVVVFSNLGMGPNLTCDHLLDRILLRLDRSRLLSLFGYVPPRSEARYHCFLRPYRTAFQVEHNEGSGAVRVNLRGRDPRGCVAPGQPMERLLDRLTDDLMALVNPNSGKPIVSRVLRTDQLYPGERRDRLPDMFVLWNRSEAASTAVSRRVGTVFAPPPRWRPGNHRSHGFFFAAGPSVKSRGPVESARIEDVAPSICHLLGVKLQDVDGRRIPSIGD